MEESELIGVLKRLADAGHETNKRISDAASQQSVMIAMIYSLIATHPDKKALLEHFRKTFKSLATDDPSTRAIPPSPLVLALFGNAMGKPLLE